MPSTTAHSDKLDKYVTEMSFLVKSMKICVLEIWSDHTFIFNLTLDNSLFSVHNG